MSDEATDLDDEEALDFSEEPAAPQLAPASLLEGRLRIERLLGRGGMSEVYLAYDERVRRPVAVKLMLTEHDPDAQLGIFAEARALVRVQHPHVIGFYGVGAYRMQPFIELEAATGGALSEHVSAAGGRLELGAALGVVVAVAEGLEALHARRMVHRDVKPDNVLFTHDGRPVLADFGLAAHDDDMPLPTRRSVGTPAYMAPEAILGVVGTLEDHMLADQYSLAVTLYHAVSGAVPFDATTPQGLIYQQLSVVPAPLRERRTGVPAALDAAVARALAKRPEDRFPTLAAFRAALESVRASLPLGTAATQKMRAMA